MVAAGEEDVGGVVGGEVEDCLFADAAGAWDGVLVYEELVVWDWECGPPVRRMTLPERSGTSLSVSKPRKTTMVI